MVVSACAQPTETPLEIMLGSPTPDEISTWTPRPKDLTETALPTATEPTSASDAPSATPVPTNTPGATSTPTRVTLTMSGGNLNVRRGPGLSYNFAGALYDGDVVEIIARDRISRWVMIELPSRPGVKGWVTTETSYSIIDGDVSTLPFIETEPATPSFIRNCTKHTVLVLPSYVYLLSKFDEPDNEERFGVGIYQIYDVDVGEAIRLEDINLIEGQTVDIRIDGDGLKSKCE